MKLVVLNHKMNIAYNELDTYINALACIKRDNIELVVCPSDIYLLKFIERGFVVGGQNVSFNEKGNYTGEISALQLKSIGAKYCIVGHSERRKYFDEDSNIIHRKIQMLLANNIQPILCVGENLSDKEKKISKKVIMEQIALSIDGIPKDSLKDIVIAYEPVWAIGSGMFPSLDYIADIVDCIKTSIKQVTGVDIRVLYGGSVSDENILGLQSIDILDGYLLGNVSLDTKKMSNLTEKL